MQTRNKDSMQVFFKEFLFSIVFAALYFPPTQCPHLHEKGAVKQRADRRRQGEEEGLEMAKICGHPLRMTPIEE